jgi:hypothetical protein
MWSFQQVKLDDFMADPTKVSIWITLFCYFVAMTKWLRAGASVPNYRGWWTVGCVAYVLHVLAAFEFHHSWSHAAAYEQTARQTAEVVGRAFGAGVFVNYLFTLLWVGEAMWWWIDERSFLRRATWINRTWLAFFFFIVFNATVVFEDGPVRWLGGIGCGWLIVLYNANRSSGKCDRTRES